MKSTRGFAFMTVDWDGKIRMVLPPVCHAALIGLKDRFDVAFACDTDHDRHASSRASGGLHAAESLSVGDDRLSVPHGRTGPRNAAVGRRS